jgi:hypothetical protein
MSSGNPVGISLQRKLSHTSVTRLQQKTLHGILICMRRTSPPMSVASIPAGRGGDIPFPNRLELRKVLHREVPRWAAATPTVGVHFVAQFQSILTFHKGALQEPDNPSAPAAEVDALPLSAPSPVGLLTQAAKRGKARIVEEPVKKTRARPVKAPAPAPAPSTPPVAGPSKKHKAPRWELSSEVSDSNNDETPTKKATEMPIFEAMQGGV